MTMKYSTQGFTLIELAMVLLILGLLLSRFLAPLAARVEQQQRNNTQIQLDEIKEVIYGFVLQNHYFPCPDCSDNTGGCAVVEASDPDDINDGEEDFVNGAGTSLICANDYGNLPWVTLGVKGTDEWNNIFTYHVDRDFADRDDPDKSDGTGCAASATLNVSFSLCSVGNIDVWNMADTADPDYARVADDIPAIVVSHGKNFLDNAPSADETENLNNNTTFVNTVYNTATGTEFDDMLIWISPHILRTMSVKAGILP